MEARPCPSIEKETIWPILTIECAPFFSADKHVIQTSPKPKGHNISKMCFCFKTLGVWPQQASAAKHIDAESDNGPDE